MTTLMPAARLPECLLAKARLLPDREAILPLLPKHKVIAEVGVALGDFSDLFIRVCDPERFIAIDLFDLHHVPELWGRPTSELFSGGTHGAFYHKRFAGAIAQGKVSVLEGDSTEKLTGLEDASLDIVYIDADHSYEAVKRDLTIVSRKIRDDGWIILNDYVMSDWSSSNGPYGVVQATNEFMIGENWEMIYLALQQHMYCDVVIRKVSSEPTSLPEPYNPGVRHVELETHNVFLKNELDAMRTSSSWRITAPLRALRRTLTSHHNR
jgi:hypothetical protein